MIHRIGIVDAVEHHLVEENCIVEEEKGASDKIFEYDEFEISNDKMREFDEEKSDKKYFRYINEVLLNASI